MVARPLLTTVLLAWAPSAAKGTCRSDICTDYASDCCAPGDEPRGCSLAGYEVQPDPSGASGWSSCVSTYGQQSVYQCCSEGSGSASRYADPPSNAGSPTQLASSELQVICLFRSNLYSPN